jgi:hypothetical protein
MTPSKNHVTVVCASPGKIVACAVERPRDMRHNTVGSDDKVIQGGRFRARA